jgi:hypothetical protein
MDRALAQRLRTLIQLMDTKASYGIPFPVDRLRAQRGILG